MKYYIKFEMQSQN
jgi:fatty acyl-CoA reductase